MAGSDVGWLEMGLLFGLLFMDGSFFVEGGCLLWRRRVDGYMGEQASHSSIAGGENGRGWDSQGGGKPGSYSIRSVYG